MDDCKLKFNDCPVCGEKSKIRLKNDNKEDKTKRYYCKICSQIFKSELESEGKDE
jgi:transcription elongation factor Elf1